MRRAVIGIGPQSTIERGFSGSQIILQEMSGGQRRLQFFITRRLADQHLKLRLSPGSFIRRQPTFTGDDAQLSLLLCRRTGLIELLLCASGDIGKFPPRLIDLPLQSQCIGLRKILAQLADSR